MSREVLVRQTAEADLAVITAIYAEAVRTGVGSFELQPPELGQMTRRWRNRAVLGLPHVVAVIGADVVGYAYISRHRTSQAYRFMVEDSIFVAPGAQRLGVGRALLADLIGRSEALDFRQMIALIADSNAASVRVHEHFGFRQVGLLEGSAFKHGRWISTLLMQRAIGKGAMSAPIDEPVDYTASNGR